MFSKPSSSNRSGTEQPIVHGTAGRLATRLAKTSAEVRAAQKLRYQVFCTEMSAKAGMLDHLMRRESDPHDKSCDHLLVIDKSQKTNRGIVGTQRFKVSCASDSEVAFYSQTEFDINALLERHPDKRFMELGRSCVLSGYRSKRTMELMWHGTWDYALQQNADVMFGCASFHATDLSAIKNSIAFLVQNAPAEKHWRVTSGHENAMDLKKYETSDVDPKTALKEMPTLIKGYLRLGAKFSKVAVRDAEFGTIDILVVLPVKDISPKYISYYGETAERHRGAA